MATKNLVIIPTYNEANNIRALIPEVWQAVPNLHILIIDDNSQDNTAGVVHSLQAGAKEKLHLMPRPRKLGLGTAYIAGFKWALGNGYERVIQMDADFSHDPKVLPQMLNALETAPVIVGSRYVQGGGTVNWNFMRRMISQFGSFYARVILGLKLNDLTGGFNAWRREVLEAMDVDSLKSEGYAFQIELKYRATKLGFAVQELPIVFNERRAGKSKMSFFICLEALLRVWMLKSRH